MKKLLWIGDAVVSTGFARVTHEVLNRLQDWEILVLGINYYGEPHNYPYKIFPCVDPYRHASHPFGIDRMPEMVQYYAPDLIVVQNDSWNIPPYLDMKGDIRLAAVMPVDGKNIRGKKLNGLAHAVFWTEFGMKEAQIGGYTGDASVVPLGVDTDRYYPAPMQKKDLRIQQALPERLHDGFIVGNVNRNQPRKRLDLTISFFCQWVKEYNIPDAYLYLHAAPTGEMEFELGQLMEYYGLSNRLITFIPNPGHGVPESRMPIIYNTFDMQITTTQGEGWGLTTMEGVACGIPQVVPDWAALGEWMYDDAKVPCSEIACTINRINMIGGIPSRVDFIEKMNQVYSDSNLRNRMISTGLRLVGRDKYRWEHIAQKFSDVFMSIFEIPVSVKYG